MAENLFEYFLENGRATRPFSKETEKQIKDIFGSLSAADKSYIGDKPFTRYTVYAKVKSKSYIILDDYNGKFHDEHPYDGLIVTIAASTQDRGKGVANQLLQDAIKDNRDRELIAEIDKSNKHSINLFERNGFKKFATDGNILYYKH